MTRRSNPHQPFWRLDFRSMKGFGAAEYWAVTRAKKMICQGFGDGVMEYKVPDTDKSRIFEFRTVDQTQPAERNLIIVEVTP